MDITGNCDVSYSAASNGWYTMTIKKTKDTLGCLDRHGYKTAMQGTPYRVPSVSYHNFKAKKETKCIAIINHKYGNGIII